MKDAPSLPLAFVTPKKTTSLFYVTNATNMRSILAAGQIRGSAGWPKYANDYQMLTPGWIPFYSGCIPEDTANIVTQHDKNDFAVVIEFEASEWSASNILAVKESGEIEEARLQELPQTTTCVLLRGLIPLADAKALHFDNNKFAQRFTSDCEALSNVRADLINAGAGIHTLKKFKFKPPEKQHLNNKAGIDCATATRRADSLGGVLASLSRAPASNTRALLEKLIQGWTPTGNAGVEAPKYPADLYTALGDWLVQSAPAPGDTAGFILTTMLDYLSAGQQASGVLAEHFLEHLENVGNSISDKHRDTYMERLRKVRETVLHDADPSHLFRGIKPEQPPLFPGLLLYLLAPEYSEQYLTPLGCNPSANDLLTADILRGAALGWSRAPLTMRGPKQFELAIAYTSARLLNTEAHNLQLPERRFKWEDADLLMTAWIAKLLESIQANADYSELKRLLTTQNASEIEINIKYKIPKVNSKKASARGIVKNKTKPGKPRFSISMLLQ